MTEAQFRIKRIYTPPHRDDGVRVLVDRLWPRGVRKDDAKLDHWAKDVAPSPELRKWFGHAPERFDEFYRRYTAELSENESAVGILRLHVGTTTLVYAARDEAHNHAVVLKQFLSS